MTEDIIDSVGLATIREIAENKGFVNLSEILQYWIMEEPLLVFNANGNFQKVQKSKLIQKLNFVSVDARVYAAIVDMGMIYSYPRRSRKTWCYNLHLGGFVTKIINFVISRHQLATKLIMVNDPYTLWYSMKNDERDY